MVPEVSMQIRRFFSLARLSVQSWLDDYAPSMGAAIEGVIRSGAEESDQGAAAGLISAGVLLVGATTVFAELQRALDRIWEVPVQEKQSGIWNLLRARQVGPNVTPPGG